MTFSQRYTIEVPLGENEVGAVWRGRATEGGSRVAIVMLEDDAPDDVRARFEDHAKKLATLRHPNVARAIEHGVTEDGAPFLVLELVEGVSLAKRLATDPPLTVGRAVELVSHLAEGLLAAHAAGLTHGDIEPGNVLLVEAEGTLVPKLVGFALNRADRRAQRDAAARLSLPSLATQWAYAAPEQVRGETVASAAADLYSLGAVLFATLAGHPPHVAPDVTSLLEAIAHGKAPALGSLKKELASFSTILERALASTADKRPADVTAFLRGLKTATAFAKTAHALPVPVGVRSPIGTPPAPAAKVMAAMPRPVARPGSPPNAGAKVVVQKPGAPAAMAPAAAAALETARAAAPEPTLDDEPRESIELLSVPPPARPPPPPKASSEGADLGDIAIDTDDAEAAEPAASVAPSTAAGNGEHGKSTERDAHGKTAAGERPTSQTHGETAADERPKSQAHGEAVAGEPAESAEHAESAARAAAPERDDEPPAQTVKPTIDEPAEAAGPAPPAKHAPAVTEPAKLAPPAKQAEAITGPAEVAEAVEEAAAAEPTKGAEPAKEATRHAEPAKPATEAAKVADSAKGTPPARADARPLGDATPAAPSKSERRAPETEAAAQRVSSATAPIEALPDSGDDRGAPARPAWVLPAAGLGALALAAVAFFAFRGGDATEPAPPVTEPSAAHASTEADEAPSEAAEPSIEAAADDAIDEGAEAAPVAATEPVPEAEPVEEPEPGPAAPAEPAPAATARAAPPSTPARTATTSPRASTGAPRGTAARAPRTRAPATTAPRERPTVVADPGF